MYLFVALLIPGYQGYVHTCVEKTQNSTFLSKSLYSMGYNYASLDGNSDVTVGVVSYNKQSSQYCATGMLNSKTVYKESLNSFLDFNATWTVINTILLSI